MPFDATPVSEHPRRLPAVDPSLLAFGEMPQSPEAAGFRPVPAWHLARDPERVGDTIGVLARARELIADEGRWCRRSFARHPGVRKIHHRPTLLCPGRDHAGGARVGNEGRGRPHRARMADRLPDAGLK